MDRARHTSIDLLARHGLTSYVYLGNSEKLDLSIDETLTSANQISDFGTAYRYKLASQNPSFVEQFYFWVMVIVIKVINSEINIMACLQVTFIAHDWFKIINFLLCNNF